MTAVAARVQKKIGKTREGLESALASGNLDERSRLEKKLRKLRQRIEGPQLDPARNIPKEAFRVRHLWHK